MLDSDRPGIYACDARVIQGISLITDDLEATRAELVARGLEVSQPFHFGPKGQPPGLHPERASYNSFASFGDPDGKSGLPSPF